MSSLSIRPEEDYSKPTEPPIAEVQSWIRSISTTKQRKHVTKGLRIKVRFENTVNINGTKQLKELWYGGVINSVSANGSQIEIKYDDGAFEVSQFPDVDIVIDDYKNGQHVGSAEAFIQPLVGGHACKSEDKSIVVIPKSRSHSKPIKKRPALTSEESCTGSKSEIIHVPRKKKQSSISIKSPDFTQYQQRASINQKPMEERHLIELTPEQSSGLGVIYPIGCPVWYNFQATDSSSNAFNFSLGIVQQVKMDVVGKVILYCIVSGSEVSEPMSMAFEDDIGFGSGCEVEVDGSQAVILCANPVNENGTPKVVHTVNLFNGSSIKIERNVLSSRIKYVDRRPNNNSLSLPGEKHLFKNEPCAITPAASHTPNMDFNNVVCNPPSDKLERNTVLKVKFKRKMTSY